MIAKAQRSYLSSTLHLVPRGAEAAAPAVARSARATCADVRVRAGDVIGDKYRVESVLGEGGMGYVVRARHVQLGHHVALKFLHHASMTRESKRRLLREARGVAALRSQHVARVLDLGRERNGTPYIVMEHLDGCDLSELLKQRGALPVEEACLYVMQACEALEEAHRNGIVHRDLALGNLFLTRGLNGHPVIKVLDFGLSKVPDHVEHPEGVTRLGGALTQAGVVFGSPYFMSPEQLLSSHAADARSDVWALGVILFTLVTGRMPFNAEAFGALVQQIASSPVPRLSDVSVGLPEALGGVVARCLERSRSHRVRSCAELAALLMPFVWRSSGPREAGKAAANALPPQLPRTEQVAPALSDAESPPANTPVKPPPQVDLLLGEPHPSTMTLAVLALAITCLAAAIVVTALWFR